MDDKQFHQIYEVENDHFWYKARREIIEEVLKAHNLCQNQFSVLEIGSANGANHQYFKHYFKSVKGYEINLEAISIASKKLPDIEFNNEHLPYNIGYENEKFDIDACHYRRYNIDIFNPKSYFSRFFYFV